MSEITFEDLKSGKVRPEVGNPKHIAVVRAYEEHQEFMKNELKKRLFKVTLSVTGTYEVEVRAKDQDEARELALEEGISCVDYDDVEIDHILEIRSR